MRTRIRYIHVIQLYQRYHKRTLNINKKKIKHLLPLTKAMQFVGIHVPPSMTFVSDSSTKPLLGCKGLVTSLKVFKEISQYS